MYFDADRAPRKIAPGVFMVGGPDLSDPRDCLCYLLKGPRACVLVDCGAGPSVDGILELVKQVCGGLPSHLLITHAHIDHCGGAAEIKRRSGCQVIIHRQDAPVLAGGDSLRSAAKWYGLVLEPLEADWVLEGDEVLDLGGGQELLIMHIPGHTPGSLAAFFDTGQEKVLFGQDVHGPFSSEFGSDLGKWRSSMQRLLELKADVLAEGHYGVFRPASEVESFIRQQLGAHR